jgi:hypothetical protein
LSVRFGVCTIFGVSETLITRLYMVDGRACNGVGGRMSTSSEQAAVQAINNSAGKSLTCIR